MANLWRKKTDSSLFEEGRAKKEINAVRSKAPVMGFVIKGSKFGTF